MLLAWGKRGYGFSAYNLAVSLKYYSPSIGITLLATEAVMKQVPDRSVFDNIVWIEEPATNPGRFKVSIYKYLPYDYNLYLDVDALCLRNIEGLFDTLIAGGGHYYTFINAVYDSTSPNLLPDMYWAYKDDIWSHYALTDHKLPATQSSIQFIRKSVQAQELFALIEQCFDNPIPLDRLRNQWGGGQPDELYLNVALALRGEAPHIGENVLWFGNRGSLRPHLVEASYYFLSLFGNKANIKPMFKTYYDKKLITMCGSRGHGHHYKWHAIASDKHANIRHSVIPGPPAQALAPQPAPVVIVGNETIHLFTSYFQGDNAARNEEITRVMQINCACSSITRIYNIGTPYNHPKVVNIPCERPTFTQFVEAANTNPGDYSIIANSDIYFTSEIELIKSLDLGRHKALALSRYDVSGGKAKLFNYEYSQDTWIFKGAPGEIKNTDYPMGKPGVDNRFCFEMQRAGYEVINPSFDVKTYHLHVAGGRTYTEADRIQGDYLPVKPGKIAGHSAKTLLIHQPGKVGDILICLPIAKWYADRGYKVDWMCPVQYHNLFRYAPYARAVESPQGMYDKTIDLSFGIIQNTPLHVWWIKNRHTFPSFVNAKYHLAGVDVKERANLVYTRNEQREAALIEALDIGSEPFVLTHTASDYGTPAEVTSPYRMIEFAPVQDYTIFDWRGVIERAKEIHCIDSSLANFIEVLRPEADCFFYPVKERQTPSLFDFTFWKQVEEYANS